MRSGPRTQISRAAATPKRGVEREIGRQAGDRDRQQPAEGLGIDQEGVADPVKPGEEIAEAEAPAGGRRGQAPLQRPAAEPSTSQTSTGKVRNSIGQALIGASASAETAPATKAMPARRQPEASMTAWRGG